MPKKSLKLIGPARYYRGLTARQKSARKKEIKKFGAMDWRDPKAYVGFKTDTVRSVTDRRKRKSNYTLAWDKLFPGKKTLKQRSAVTGVPLKYIDTVFRRGSAAWRTGHRPGQTTQSWSYPRVSSFLLCGKAHYTADADQVRAARATSASARKWFKRCAVKSPY
jgi:hypothetical protein